AVREELRGQELQRDREDVEPREHVLGGRAARAADAAEISASEVDEIEDDLLVELIRIVELPGDDASAAGERMDEGVDEGLVVKTDFAAGRIAGVVALKRPEAVDQTIRLRAMVVRQDLEVLADDDGIRSARRHHARHGHGLGAAGELPEQLVSAAESVGRRRRSLGRDRVAELDAINRFILETRALADVELVAVAV